MSIVKKSVLLSALSCALLFSAAEASAKCTVTLKFLNNDTHDITMLGNESQARVNGGTWSKMSFNNVVIKPGATGSTSWTTNMSCGGNAKRDLRLKYQDSGDGNTYPRMVDNVNIDDGLTYGPYSVKND